METDVKYDVDLWFITKVGRRTHTIILVIFLVILFSFLIGDGEARNQKEFLTIKTRPNTVILRTYGDMLICAQFDQASKTTNNELILLYMSKLDDLTLVQQKIGPLKPIQSPAIPQPSPKPSATVTPSKTPTISPSAQTNTPATPANQNGATP